MPPFEVMDLNQTALLWEKTGDDLHGEPVLAEPVEISVRWVWEDRVASGSQGNPVALDATVVVEIDVPWGSVLWEGDLDDWYSAGSAGAYLMEVASLSTTPDIKNRHTRRTLGLTRFRGELP
jgi:hypothetical protein